MAFERPPRGYNQRDRPLPHNFGQTLRLSFDVTNLDLETMQVYYLSTNQSNSPSTIEVNPRNSAFAEDAGSVVLPESMVQMARITTTFSITEAGFDDNLRFVTIYHQNIHGSFGDTWTPSDAKTTKTIAQLCGVVSTDAQEDVRPAFTGDDLDGADPYPLSDVTATDTVARMDLTTDVAAEAVLWDIDQTADAFRWFTNGGKLKTVLGPIRAVRLNQARNPSITIFENKFVPKNVRFMNPNTFFAKRFKMPNKDDFRQSTPTDFTGTASKAQVEIKSTVFFNEWNRDFEQKMM